VGRLFTERKDQLASIITEEMGKRRSEALAEAEFCTEIFNYYATEGPGLAADQPIKALHGARAIIQKLPVGPLLGIMPWNYPYYQVARFAAPNLVLGNTIILKHAENCPRSALAIQQIMEDAGLPRGAYLNVFANHHRGSADPGRFTHRIRTGRRRSRPNRRTQPQESGPGTRRFRPVHRPGQRGCKSLRKGRL